jgi:hypothetical protein
MRLPAAILMGALILAGCTVQADFAVVNQAPWPARLTVRLLKVGQCAIQEHPLIAVAPAPELEPGVFRRRQPHWAPLGPQEFNISEADCVLTVDVPPETAIRVARLANHPPPASAEPWLLAVQEVSVRWSTGQAADLGTESLMRLFRKARPGVYAVDMRPAA